jgi:ribosomal protein L11 methyltransferase
MYRDAEPPMCFFAYFPPGVVLPDVGDLSAFAGVSVLEVENFEDEDWLAKSREGFGSFEVGRSFFIRPTWDDSPSPAGRIPIVVNPGLAFGTGGHETTRLCMCLLEDLALDHKLCGPVLDIGSGTGILAYTSHLLGADDITALDIDADCLPAMEEFIDLNSSTARHKYPFLPMIGTLDDPQLNKPFNLILANILLETIQVLLPQMFERLAPQGHLIVSGILAERQDEALLSLALHGLKPLKLVIEGEWVAIECLAL